MDSFWATLYRYYSVPASDVRFFSTVCSCLSCLAYILSFLRTMFTIFILLILFLLFCMDRVVWLDWNNNWLADIGELGSRQCTAFKGTQSNREISASKTKLVLAVIRGVNIRPLSPYWRLATFTIISATGLLQIAPHICLSTGWPKIVSHDQMIKKIVLNPVKACEWD